jgi:hypothetical protein
MPISVTRERLEHGLVAFAWEEWAQMGVLATHRSPSPWAQDPEALLVYTFEVARADPRLFDAVLDWLVANEHLISVRRLRTLSRTPPDRRLTDAVLAWLGHHRPKARFPKPERPQQPLWDLAPLHPSAAGFPVRHPDEAFAEFGWLRPATPPSGNASAPDLRAPINLSFRLRQLLGVGARAEVVRLLLTSDVPRVTAWVIAQSAAYAKRNVQEALNALVQAGVVAPTTVGHEQRYGIEGAAWATLLRLDGGFPRHVDWVQLLGGLRDILRWLRELDEVETSDYMLASQARDLLDEVRSDLEFAGVVVPRQRTADESLADIDAVVAQGLQRLVH